MTATLLRTTRFCFARLSMLLICLLRCSTSANHSALSKFDGILHETCHSANHYIHNLSESQWVQASLPVRNGSLGIRGVSMWPLRQAPCHWSPTSCPIVLLQIAVVCSHTCCLGGLSLAMSQWTCRLWTALLPLELEVSDYAYIRVRHWCQNSHTRQRVLLHCCSAVYICSHTVHGGRACTWTWSEGRDGTVHGLLVAHCSRMAECMTLIDCYCGVNNAARITQARHIPAPLLSRTHSNSSLPATCARRHTTVVIVASLWGGYERDRDEMRHEWSMCAARDMATTLHAHRLLHPWHPPRLSHYINATEKTVLLLFLPYLWFLFTF